MEELINRERGVLKKLIIFYVSIFAVNFLHGFIKGFIRGYYKNDGYELEDFSLFSLCVNFGYSILLLIFLLGILFCVFMIFKNAEYFKCEVLRNDFGDDILFIDRIYKVQKLYIILHICFIFVKSYLASLGWDLKYVNYIFPDLGYIFLILLQVWKLKRMKVLCKCVSQV